MLATLVMECLLLVGLLGCSAFFSGTEIALFSLSKLQLRRLRQEDPRRGQVVNELLEQPQVLLSTILLGNTVVNVGIAVLGYHILGILLQSHAEQWAVPVVTVLVLLVGEVTPKTLVIRNAEFYALRVAVVIRWIIRAMSPARRSADQLAGWIVKRVEQISYFADRRVRSHTPTEEEYRTLLRLGEHTGVLRREERTMVNKILALEDTQVKEIMTPRVDMQCVDDSWSREQMVKELRRYKHRRVPIIHDTPDTVEGLLNVKEFLINPDCDLDDVVALPNFVPETMSVSRLFKSFRKQEHPIAIVVDEHGGTQGMVTLEDILEEIVGEITDEFDTSEILVQKLAAGHFLINGKARLEEVNEQCGIYLQAEDVDTIAGWLISQLGTLPKDGDSVRADNVRVVARKVAKNRVREVLLWVEAASK